MEFLKKYPALLNFLQFEAPLNPECLNNIIMTAKKLSTGSLWPLKMLDSSTKMPAGLLEGNTIDLGNFDECINIDVNEEGGTFKGQHCLATINTASSDEELVPFTWSMCVPSSCSAHELSNYLSTLLRHSIVMSPATCHVKEPRMLTSEDMFAISVLSVFGLVCILSTIYDKVTDEGKKKEILRAFSWYTNGKQLLAIGNGSRDTTQCLHGLRLLSVMCIIVGQTYLLPGKIPDSNMNIYRKSLAGGGSFHIGISAFSIESLFLITGLLVGYTFFKTIEQGKKFNIPLFYLVRCLRITPVLAFTTLIHSGLIMHMGNGPFWDKWMEKYPIACKKNWWTTLLYIQNYVHKHETCVTEAWYLAVETQLYILSPLLLIQLVKRPRYGPNILKFVITLSIIISFLQLYINDVTFGFQAERRHDFAEYFYTHSRATSWLIGLSLSYFIHITRSWRQDNQWNLLGLSKKHILVGWLAGCICLVLPVAWSHRFSQTDFLPSSLEFAFYFSLSRALWCLGISWIIFACMAGYGGPVESFLSWEILQPLSRMTYSIYLMFYLFLLVKKSSVKHTMYFSEYAQVNSTLGTVMGSFILAIPVYLAFEAPAIALTKATSSNSYEKIPSGKSFKA